MLVASMCTLLWMHLVDLVITILQFHSTILAEEVALRTLQEILQPFTSQMQHMASLP